MKVEICPMVKRPRSHMVKKRSTLKRLVVNPTRIYWFRIFTVTYIACKIVCCCGKEYVQINNAGYFLIVCLLCYYESIILCFYNNLINEYIYILYTFGEWLNAGIILTCHFVYNSKNEPLERLPGKWLATRTAWQEALHVTAGPENDFRKYGFYNDKHTEFRKGRLL